VTYDVDEYWGITVSHGRKSGPKLWVATAQAFRKDTMEDVGPAVEGSGATQNTADKMALAAAKQFLARLRAPANWKGSV
jgi:hypothetical protein